MTFLIGLLSFFYLVKFTEIHTKGYQLRKLEMERDRLMSSREVQSTGISKLKALNSIRESSKISQMVPARTPIYLRQDGNVAQLP